MCSNNVGTMEIRGETYTTVAYYTQGEVFALRSVNDAVMGWPNPPGTVRWIDLFGISSSGDNIAIVYLGLPPTKPNDITMYVPHNIEQFFSCLGRCDCALTRT